MTRRQLEYEARQIRVAMEEQLGSCQDMEKRTQRRITRIQQIEKDILRIRQLLQSQATEALVFEGHTSLCCDRDRQLTARWRLWSAAPCFCEPVSLRPSEL
ncbi:adenomatous polyposis coli protein-like [Muntiacus reevesi]|uniref:adenomatous polyposis coli protein-like n=1 Tax=Muntiacus reevesi TaxID=9886 RepID=UPI003306EF9E